MLQGYNILILSDRHMNRDYIAIPALLATSAVHHHLIRQGLRTSSGLVVETGAALEVHHFATLAGYGAEAINPYLAFDTIAEMLPRLPEELDFEEAQKRYIKAVGKGLLKVMSKMGISTYQSYCGAQIFDAVGLVHQVRGAVLHRHPYPGRGRRPGRDRRGDRALAPRRLRRSHIYRKHLDVGGDYAYRLRGEDHVWTPETIAKLQHATRANSWETYEEYARMINEQTEKLLTFRGLMDFKWADEPIPLDEVEPAEEIVKRFATGAMSFGRISYEAHSTLAMAMNRIGGKSNTGEGGEEPERFNPLAGRLQESGTLRHQAGGLRSLRRDHRVPGQRRRHPDQDGPGRQARRGRPAARPQGQQPDRAGAPLHPGRGPDLAAAAPRHLLHRGPGAADPRSEERQSAGAHLGQAGLRGGRGHGRRGCLQGPCGPRDHRRLRRRHRRLPADLHQARRLPLGDRPGRDPPDPGAEPPARAHRGAGGRRHAHRPRRGGRRCCWVPTSSASPPRR